MLCKGFREYSLVVIYTRILTVYLLTVQPGRVHMRWVEMH